MSSQEAIVAAAKETPEHQRDIAHWLMDEAQKVVNARAGMCGCAARRAAPHDPRGCRIATCVAMCAHATLVPVHQALDAPPLQWARGLKFECRFHDKWVNDASRNGC